MFFAFMFISLIMKKGCISKLQFYYIIIYEKQMFKVF